MLSPKMAASFTSARAEKLPENDNGHCERKTSELHPHILIIRRSLAWRLFSIVSDQILRQIKDGLTLALIPAFSRGRRRNAPSVSSYLRGWIGGGVFKLQQIVPGSILSPGRKQVREVVNSAMPLT